MRASPISKPVFIILLYHDVRGGHKKEEKIKEESATEHTEITEGGSGLFLTEPFKKQEAGMFFLLLKDYPFSL
jgi:hypothetical protein